MSKVTGGVRSLGVRYGAKMNRFNEFKEKIKSGDYVSKRSFFNRESGGFVLFHKEHNYHIEELSCAKVLMKNGYKVYLNSEKGNVKIGDGYLFNMSYEQRSLTGEGIPNVKKGVQHGDSKGVDIAVLYLPKGHKHNRESIEKGIKEYESKSKYRLKKILVVTENGYVHIHRHNE